MGKCRLFIIHHGKENYPALCNTIATPILGGSGSDKDVGDFGSRIFQRETEEPTICDKHNLLSEFSVYYWIWQHITTANNPPQYVGIFHYRTFLNLGDSGFSGDFLTKMGITEENITALLQNNDVIITDVSMESWYKDWQKSGLTIIQQFKNCHLLGDLLFKKTIDFLKNDASNFKLFKAPSSEIGPFAEWYFNLRFTTKVTDYKPYFKSVFVSTVKYFNVYMDYLFTILDYLMENEEIKEELAKLDDTKKYRLLAFFGERLTALFIAYSKSKNAFKIKEVERYHEENLDKFLQQVYPYKPTKDNSLVPLVRFFSNNHKLYALKPVNEKDGKKYLPSTVYLTAEKFWVDRMVGYLLKSPEKGTMPVYMLQEPKGKDYFYTTDKDEYERARTVSGYSKDFGCIGFIYTEETSSFTTLPMVRYLFNAKDRTRHFYTPYTEEAEAFGNLLGVEGVEEGVLGYIICVDQKKPILWDD